MNEPDSHPTPFAELFYGDQMNEALAGSAPTVVLGGRGMGKSAVLGWLTERLKAHLIEGRSADAAGAALDAALKNLHDGVPADVVIDDLDYLVNEERNPRDVIQPLVDKIDRVRAELAQQHKRMIVASASPITRFLGTTFTDFWSGIETRFQALTLFPWPVGWKENIESETRSRFSKLPLSTADAVVHVSGGHPSLVASAFAALHEYVASAQAQEPADWVAYLALSVGRTGLSPIEKALHTLQRSPLSDDQSAMKHLSTIVQLGGEGPAPKGPQVQRALELSGLAYCDPATGICLVPGELILRFLEEELPATSHRVVQEVRVVPRGDDEGSLHLSPPDREIQLSKGLWHLVHTLHNARGDIVSVDDIVTALGLESQKPLYSIVQRLDQKAKEAQLDRIIENVRGQGYRLNRSLRWKR